MARYSKIGWTDSTFSPWYGCTNVSPGCENCYAEAWAKKYGLVEWGNAPRRRAAASTWREPLSWNRQATKFFSGHGHRQRVFAAELADIFDNQVLPEWRDDFWELVRSTPKLDWLVLTKRPQNIRKMLPGDWGDGYANAWLGITAEDEEHYRLRWPVLSRIPAVLRFISHEPALGSLGPLDIGTGNIPGWVICGGESGPRRRFFDPEWASEDRDECARCEVPYFFKQHGGLQPLSNGCRIDGVEHKHFPSALAA